MKLLLTVCLSGLICGVLGAADNPVGKIQPSFLPVEMNLKDSQIPIASYPVTEEEIDDACERAGWGLMSRGVLHESITFANGLWLADHLEGVHLPHADWAKPWSKGPMKILMVTWVDTARQIIELGMRTDGSVNTSFISYQSSYREKASEKELFTKMIGDRIDKINPDVLLLNYSGGLPEMMKLIKDRVEKGMGLVVIAHSGQESKEEDKPKLAPDEWPVCPGLVDIETGAYLPVKAPLKVTGEPHFAWWGVPYETMPAIEISKMTYPGQGWNVLAKIADNPWILTKTLGKGRIVVIIGGRGSSMLPAVGRDTWSPAYESRLLDDRCSVVMKSLLFAAGKDSGILMDLVVPETVACKESFKAVVKIIGGEQKAKGQISITVRDDTDKTVFVLEKDCELSKGAEVTMEIPPLPRNGRFIVDAVLRDDSGKSLNWNSRGVVVADGMKLSAKVNKDVFKEGESLKATLHAPEDCTAFLPFTLVMECWDSYGRLIGKSEKEFKQGISERPEVELECDLSGCPAQIMMLVGKAMADGKEIASFSQEISKPKFGLDQEYHVVAWPGLEWERPSLHLQLLKRLGFDTILTGPWGPPVNLARLVAWNNMNLAVENAFHLPLSLSDKYWPGGSKDYDSYFESVVCPFGEQVLRKYGSVFMSMANEGIYYKHMKEKIISPVQEAGFRDYLKDIYGDIASLNRQWGTDYKNFDEAKPLPIGSKAEGMNFSRLVDWDLFMNSISIKEQKRAVDKYFELMDNQCPWGSTSCGVLEEQAEAGASFCGNTIGDGLKYSSGAEAGWYDLWHQGTSGIWAYMGYQWPEENYDFYPWYGLFHGTKTEFHFISPQNAGPEGSFTRRGLWVKTDEAPIRAGIGKLLAGSTRKNDPVAMMHSDLADIVVKHYAGAASSDKLAGQFYGRFMRSSYFSFLQLILDAQLHPSFVTAKGIESGKLKGIKILFVCGVPAMSEATAAAIRDFADGGGIVVSDMCPAIFDEHGKMLPKGRLDEFFGIERKDLKLTSYPAEYTLGILEDTQSPYYLPKEWFYVEFHEDGIAVNDGKALGRHIVGAEAPAFIFKKHGQGASLYLNYLDSQYRKNRDPRHLNFMVSLLRWANVKPSVEVTDGFVPVRQFDVVKFTDDRAIHAALIRDDTDSRRAPAVIVNFDRSGHAYDVRDGAYLGEGNSFKVDVPRWKPKLVSLMPCKVKDLILDGSGSARRGEAWKFKIKADIDGKQTSLVYRLEVKDPDGNPVDAYLQKVRTPEGSTVYEGIIRPALNDACGTWTLAATEIVSGKFGQLQFKVE